MSILETDLILKETTSTNVNDKNNNNKDENNIKFNNNYTTDNSINSNNNINTIDNLQFKRINENDVITDNPFDLLNNSSHKKLLISQKSKINSKLKSNDEKFLSLLKRIKQNDKQEKRNDRNIICKRLEILSNCKLNLKIKKYYKFPFNYNTKNDNSSLFYEILKEFSSAMNSVYLNFRKFKEEFKIKIGNDLIIFGEELKATRGIERMLKNNDIKYTIEEEYIIINKEEICILYDMIVNIEIPKGYFIPFILSDYEFDHSIVYHTKIEEGPKVKVGSDIQYLYYINGPLYTSDYNFKEISNIKYIQ